jgi:hypothetical protein
MEDLSTKLTAITMTRTVRHKQSMRTRTPSTRKTPNLLCLLGHSDTLIAATAVVTLARSLPVFAYLCKSSKATGYRLSMVVLLHLI